MKKLILAVLVLMLFALSAYAQDDAAVTKGLVGKGIKAGVTLGNFAGADADDPTSEKKMNLGFGGGAFITYAFAPMFAVQPEVLYVMKGAKYEETGGSGTDKLKFSYIEIPVLLKLMPQVKGNVRPVIFAGPFLGILVSAKDKAEGWTDPADNGDFDIKDQMKSTEFGIAAGAGVEFVAGKGKVTLDGRFDLGLSKVPEEILGVQADIKTSTIAFLVGYSF
ncbi:MAG: porin family protein [Candidatus Zixiibacteriota bacterium]